MNAKINPDLVQLARPIGFFKKDEKNARLHPKESVQAIKDSFLMFGQQKPLVVLEDGTIVAGHGGLMAAQELEWEHLAAVIFEDEKSARAYAVADNRTAEKSSWDNALLLENLQLAQEEGFKLQDLGFSEDDVEALNPKEKQGKASFQNALNYKLSYEMIFATHDQQTKFFDFVRWLNKTYSGETVAERMCAFIDERVDEVKRAQG